jgi:hypothetical protein
LFAHPYHPWKSRLNAQVEARALALGRRLLPSTIGLSAAHRNGARAEKCVLE